MVWYDGGGNPAGVTPKKVKLKIEKYIKIVRKEYIKK